MLPADQLQSLARTSHPASECADEVLDHAEQVLNRQFDATEQALKEHGERLRKLWSGVDPSGAIQDGVAIVEESARGGVELTRAYLNTVTRLQREFAHIIEWQGNANADRWREARGMRHPAHPPGRRKAA